MHPKVIDLTLDRMWRLLDALGNPQDRLPPAIHIAGTNGKGSTQAMMRAGLEAAGHRVHAYTSPHLVRFHERIRLAGTLIDEDALADTLDECEAANGGVPITYFEITTCAALLAFSRMDADYLLLEVGLGGRLDATNVIDAPRLTAITPVSMDHEGFLGNSLEEIAGEKAGIIKANVPLIVGRQQEAALELIEGKAERLRAPLQVFGQHWHAAPERDGMVYQDETGLLDLPRPALTGDHQIENAGIALNALRQLGCDESACLAAVTNAEWPGRMQRLNWPGFAGEVWLDGGHNPAAGQALAQKLATLPKRPTFMICGMLNSKDPTGFLRHFEGLVDKVTAVSIPGEQNTLSSGETAAAARKVSLPVDEAKTVRDAMALLPKDCRVVICGSLYLAGSVLRDLQD